MSQSIHTGWYQSPLPEPNPLHSKSTIANGVELICGASVMPKSVAWIWPDWLAVGRIVLLAGQPGTGKTTTAMMIAAILSQGSLCGKNWPGQEVAFKRKVIIWSGEDDIEEDLVPCLIASGADMSNIFFISGRLPNGEPREFDFSEQDLANLSALMSEIQNVGLVIIDSIMQILPGNSNGNLAVRRALVPIRKIARVHRCAVLGLTHLNKESNGKNPLDRITGSLAWGAVARGAIITAKVNSEDSSIGDRYVMVKAKNQKGKAGGGFEFTIRGAEIPSGLGTIKTSISCINDVPLKGTAQQILASAEGGAVTAVPSKLVAAARFLQTELANGPVLCSEIWDKAQQSNIAGGTLERAKAKLGVISEKLSGKGASSPFTWSLPKQQSTAWQTNGDQSSTPLLFSAPTGWPTPISHANRWQGESIHHSPASISGSGVPVGQAGHLRYPAHPGFPGVAVHAAVAGVAGHAVVAGVAGHAEAPERAASVSMTLESKTQDHTETDDFKERTVSEFAMNGCIAIPNPALTPVEMIKSNAVVAEPIGFEMDQQTLQFMVGQCKDKLVERRINHQYEPGEEFDVVEHKYQIMQEVVDQFNEAGSLSDDELELKEAKLIDQIEKTRWWEGNQ